MTASTSPYYGIHLGTTEAMIAKFCGGAIHFFRNTGGAESTPCAVYMDKANNLIVGNGAKDRCESDPENAFTEFKRDMGSNTEYCFARNGRRLKPHELFAEVLKSLCGDVQRATGETVDVAVITVPTYFDLPAIKATKEAAHLAGIRHTVLLVEPVATAQAYGFDSHRDRTCWLVYDFGGSTFDATVVQVYDGLVQVAGHGGDNHLGDKNIDWAVVEELFIPAVLKERRLTDFKRGIPKWRGAIAKLKAQAEEAKIRLSSPTMTSTAVCIDFLCNDDRGEPVKFDYLLHRSDFERLAWPFISRTVDLCKEVLAGRRLTLADIREIVLVGEGTMLPIVRHILSDPYRGLGVPLKFSVDPLTVVARGAAVFAASQRVISGDKAAPSVRVSQFAINLEYAPVGPDPDPEVAGTVTAGQAVEKDFSGYTIEFVNPGTRPPWRSGKVGLGPKGTFLTNVSAEDGRENIFEIELCDASAAIQVVTPLAFTIVTASLAHSHNLGLALPDNDVLLIYSRGTPLPFKKRLDLRTEVPALAGQDGELIRIPLVEGESRRADRNRIVGTLQIPAEKIARDVPAGSEIELTVEIDKSAQIRASAFIPILNEEFDYVMQLESATPDAKDLVSQLQKAKDRLSDLRQKADSAGDPKALAALSRIDAECMVSECEKLVGLAVSDTDAGRQCQNVLTRLNSALDDVEEFLEWPALVERAEKNLGYAGELVKNGKYPNTEYWRNLELAARETRDAIEYRMPD